MKYGFQVKVWNALEKSHEWQDVRPSGGQPYRYDDRTTAENMARLCYGNDADIVRVVEIPDWVAESVKDNVT